MGSDLSKMRREYLHSSIDEANMNDDPLLQFDEWLKHAVQAGIDVPNAMALATASANAVPSVRYVLLKGVSEKGFVFYAHTVSKKGRDLTENPLASLVFYWPSLDRQVRIEGRATLVSAEKADEYFESRPLDSKVAAWVAPQSSIVENRQYLETRFNDLEKKFADGGVPRPEEWGGYCVYPLTIEFWQGREGRLHDRIEYTREGDNSWNIHRLAP